MYASIYYNQLDVVQSLLEKEHLPTQLFMWKSPLECALQAKPSRSESPPPPNSLPVDLEMYKVLLKHEQKVRDLEDYKKVVNDFLCTVIQAKEGEAEEEVLLQVKKSVFNLLLEEQFELIDTDKAIQVCEACNDTERAQAIKDEITKRQNETA